VSSAGSAALGGGSAPVSDGAEGGGWLTVHDIKQWRYCRRVVYYQRLVPVVGRPTFKMEHGRVAEADLRRLERRRKLREYGLEDGVRHFRVALESERYRLTGTADLVVETADAVFPADFKYTEGPCRANHVTQLAAYALLAEERFRRRSDRGFVYLVPQELVEAVELTDERKRVVVDALRGIREMIAMGACPDATPVRARCQSCEYRNYCGDQF
jgi:CRISPR-associated exonuclease Cas4